jgi:Tol biopolymer transport system component
VIRRLEIGVLVLLMATFGVGVYSYLGTMKSIPKIAARATVPSHTKPRLTLPGTMFLAQGGAIFRLKDGQFTQIASGSWMQPALTPDHKNLIAVSRGANVSELFLLDMDGHVVRQLTHNANRSVSFNHWSFFPRVSPDGQNVFYSYDPKNYDNLHRVDLAIYAMPIGGTQARARNWTSPYWSSGGDVGPIPLASGSLLYTKFNVDDLGTGYSQLWLQRSPWTVPGGIGKALTSQADSCSQPSVSADGKMVAMICTGGQQVGRLEVATFDGTTLGPLRVVLDGQLAAAPSWSPDGKGLVYFAPWGPAGHFQLFYLSLPVSPTPAATASATAATPAPTPAPPTSQQVSTDLDFDTTSAAAWY